MKLIIMNTKPELSDEEIRGLMNFDGLMKEFKAAPKKPAISTTAKIVSILSGLVVISLVAYFVGLNSKNEYREHVVQKENSKNSSPDHVTETRLPGKDSVSRGSQKENSVTKKETIAKNPDPAKSNKNLIKEEKETTSTENKEESAGVIQTTGYLQAEPVNGFPHLYEYFSSELQYPEEAVKDSIQGIVTVSCIINEQGKPGKITIANSLGPVFDKEVIRLIENMPAWKPATMNGKAVPSKIAMPLTFRLERIKK